MGVLLGIGHTRLTYRRPLNGDPVPVAPLCRPLSVVSTSHEIPRYVNHKESAPKPFVFLWR